MVFNQLKQKIRGLNVFSGGNTQGISVRNRVAQLADRGEDVPEDETEDVEIIKVRKQDLEQEFRRFGAQMYDTGRGVADIETIDQDDEGGDQVALLNAAMLFIILMIQAKPYLSGLLG